MGTYVGILRPYERGGVVETGDPRLGDIWIPEQHLNGAPFGMQVVCEAEAPEPQTVTTGRIVEVLGDPGRPDVAIRAIIRTYGLSETFPEAVLQAAEALPSALTGDMIADELRRGRKDLRTLPTLTVDGLDAKDLDDALSLTALPNGGRRVYIHIADVTHYVPADGPIDLEAAERGTSVYLVDRVLPMQPPRLSNGICSLNPHQDRFALTVQLDYDRNGRYLDGDVFESVIRSDVRGNYDDVWQMIQTREPVAGYAPVMDMLMALYELSQQLRQRRSERGALDFDFPETVVELDAAGTPTDIHPHPVTAANHLIEEFMIAANVYVAERFCRAEAPFIYRVHEMPNDEKLARFAAVARRLGLTVRLPQPVTPPDLARLLDAVNRHPCRAVLAKMLLESQAKARYDAECLGHFGLALTYYAHFTSPIRRYPDLFIHRVIKGYLHGAPQIRRWRQLAGQLAERSSERERIAMQAERDTVDQKVAEFMLAHLGETASGVISGLNFSGFFVRLDNSAEGLVPFQTMQDYYIFSEEQMLAQGERSGRVFRVGDRVTVQIARADVISRRVTFELLDEPAEGAVEAPLIDRAEQARIRERSAEWADQARERRRQQPLQLADFGWEHPGSGQQKSAGRARRSSGRAAGAADAAGRRKQTVRKLKGRRQPGKRR